MFEVLYDEHKLQRFFCHAKQLPINGQHAIFQTIHVESNSVRVKQKPYAPYLIWAMSPTRMSATGSWMTWLPRTTWNFCSCSMRLCSPRNCFSLLQSLKAVTITTHATESKMAAPSIQPASASPSSSAPAAAAPHTAHKGPETTGDGQTHT